MSTVPHYYEAKPRYLTKHCRKNGGKALNVKYEDMQTIRKFVFKTMENEPVENQRVMTITYSKKFNELGERNANIWLRDVTEAPEKKPRAAEAKSEALKLGSNSLVKRSQSPTEQKAQLHAKIDGQLNELRGRKKRKFDRELHTCPEPISLASRKTYSNSEYFASLPKKGSISNEAKVCVRMYHQDWSNKYRMGLENGALGAKSAPPMAAGERITDSLSKNAVKNIMESGAYLSTCRGGFTTFVTLTFNTEARKRVLDVVAIPNSKVKKYSYQVTQLNTSTGRYKKINKHYEIRCIDGVPSEYVQTNGKIDIEKAEGKKGYCNAIPADGPWSSVEFKPLSSIGLEVSRFFDGAQKMYQRGWLPRFIDTPNQSDLFTQNQKIERVNAAIPMICPEFVDPLTQDGSDFDQEKDLIKFNHRKHSSPEYLENIYGECEKAAPLDYMWVAEMPDNELGEKNPHVHVLMRWKVEKPVFRAWAERLEALWGHGFAKLERIKNPAAASNYLLKAVGYLTKGSVSEQGEIRGNRYGISSSARAPKWQCIGEFYADNFLAILGEMREKLHRKKLRIAAQRLACTNKMTTEKGKYKKLENVNKKTFSHKRAAYIEKLKANLEQGDQTIKETTEQINKLPFVNDFAIGNMEEKQAVDFIHWAMRERYWNSEVKTNRYNQWNELKQNTIEAVKQARSHWRGYGALLQTSELTWQWSEQDLEFAERYEPEQYTSNYIDENGREWEQQQELVA